MKYKSRSIDDSVGKIGGGTGCILIEPSKPLVQSEFNFEYSVRKKYESEISLKKIKEIGKNTDYKKIFSKKPIGWKFDNSKKPIGWKFDNVCSGLGTRNKINIRHQTYL